MPTADEAGSSPSRHPVRDGDAGDTPVVVETTTVAL